MSQVGSAVQAAPGCYPALLLLHCMTQWRHHLHTCSATCPHMPCPPTHLPTALREELPNSEKASLGRREEINGFAHLGVGLLWAAFSLVALPSLARSSLPAGHRATETLAPAPALRGRHAHSHPSILANISAKENQGNAMSIYYLSSMHTATLPQI